MRRSPFWEKRWSLAAVSLTTGFLLIVILRLFDSYYEELPAAVVFGGLAFVPSGRVRRVILGALVASAGWLAGLAVANHSGQTSGLGVGTWALMSLTLFSFVGVKRVKDGKVLRGVSVALLGLAIGVAVEILQILPSFVYFLRFQDSQALGILGAAVLIPPVAARLDGVSLLDGKFR